ncbi:ABC exporter membrane fusion protein, DevB family [Xenococcus sp. PCC 7305]|uniref:ABC exporter membrane fusion protein n=1 Tax=Xenococcus sp. PCC 7305 TaxID=102125 RepID=UPI0002ABD9DF|nr:ABC exporter membrane fusion protein [Xenococcus sp. PCC 7305]ELS04650.1 ABC exporter membrane fusion protein, DevB family [Xenococcus sp. PCC 7305]
MFYLNRKKSNLIPMSVGTLVLLSGIAIYAINRNNTQAEIAEPTIPVTETIELKSVTALGRIEPEGEVIQLSPSPDLGGTKINQLLVKEGDLVTQGQTIAILDNNERSQANVELARQDVKVAEANLAIVKAGAKSGEITAQEATVKRIQAQLRGEILANEALIARLEAQLRTETEEKQATIERLEAELVKAEIDLRRYTKLEADGVISESELESRGLDVDTAQKRLVEAQAAYNRTLETMQEQINETKAISQQEIDTLEEQISEAEATLDRIAEVRDVDVIKAQAEVGRAIAALKQAEEDLKLSYVTAPTDGQIINIYTYPGEIVGDDGVVEFGQTNQMIVVAEVYESDINRVQLGKKATVISETGAFEGEITGTVSHIGLKIGKQDVLDTDPAADVDSRVVEVEIRLDSDSSDRVSALTNSKAIVNIEK